MTPARPRAVLVARSPERGAGLATGLRDAGLEVVVAPVIERAPVADPAPLDDAVRGLAHGAYAWAVVTSVNAVDALAGAAARTGTDLAAAPVRWAAVGPATSRALDDAGVTTDLVPDGDATAAGLVATFPDPGSPDATPRVLLPLGDLARPTLQDGLAGRGWAPHVVTAYRTVHHELPADVAARARSGGFDLVVVSSGSVAREIAAQAGTGTPVVAIGAPSAAAARDAGLRVAAVAAQPTDDALADAVAASLGLPPHDLAADPTATAPPSTKEHP
ncbi:uroporphyrinogen-III synthase [Isoptericola sp. 4D.3]|uniref:Uroporphyrinogen-III synthase n=1 Tax=Isoptericola peretonis TaxID=2918523 RepID=A0ABT0J6J0_9MICO|nr:uroporphyrinogen-III synthase [Isoptericola sp. 4D.3]